MYKLSAIEIRIIEAIKNDCAISQAGLADKLDMDKNTVKYYTNKLRDKNVISRSGSNRSGVWKVNAAYHKLPDYLRRKTEIDKTLVTKRYVIDSALIDKSRKFLREYFNVMDVPADEDGLIAFVIDMFSNKKNEYEELLNTQYSIYEYPDKKVVEGGIKTLESLLSQKKDNTALLKTMMSMNDDLLDLGDDIADVLSFFKNQKTIFDSTRKLLSKLEKETDYFQTEESMTRELRTAKEII